MKRFLLIVAGVSLVVPDIALALQARPAPTKDQPRPPRPGGGTKPARPGGAAILPVRPGGPQIQPPRPNPGGGVRPPRPNPGNGIRPPRPNPGGGVRPPRPNPGNGIRPPRPNPGNGIRPPHRPGEGRPPNFRPIRGPVFKYPRGYRYRRWAIGLFLPSLFLSNNYYYDNWAPLGIGAPPRGYRWVRYGPDLLLVQNGTRRIVDVIYGVFY